MMCIFPINVEEFRGEILEEEPRCSTCLFLRGSDGRVWFGFAGGVLHNRGVTTHPFANAPTGDGYRVPNDNQV